TSRLARKKNKLQIGAEYGVARSLLAALEYLPLPLARRLASGMTRLLDLAVPKLRKTAVKNLGFAFPEWRPHEQDQVIDGVFQSISRLLLAIARFPQLNGNNIHEWIRYEG